VGGFDQPSQYQAVFSSINPLPATLTVGDSGQLASGSYSIAGLSGAPTAGTFAETYSVSANNATTVKLTLTTTGSPLAQQATDTEVEVFTVDASGRITLVSIQLNLTGTVYTFNPQEDLPFELTASVFQEAAGPRKHITSEECVKRAK
jgi:hypothetical protein